MLVVDIPKRTLVQDAADIRHLKKNDRILAIRDRADRRQKPVRLPDMLQRHLATQQIGRDLVRVSREEFAHEPHILVRALPGGDEARIIADTTIIPKLANQAQELTFPATNLQHGLATDIVAADELFGDGAVE